MPAPALHILIVHHNNHLHTHFEALCQRLFAQLGVHHHTKVLTAQTTQQAEELLDLQEVALIIVSASAPYSPIDTYGLIQKITPTHRGLRIGWTGVEECQKQLLVAGCHEVCSKVSDLLNRLQSLVSEKCVTRLI